MADSGRGAASAQTCRAGRRRPCQGPQGLGPGELGALHPIFCPDSTLLWVRSAPPSRPTPQFPGPRGNLMGSAPSGFLCGCHSGATSPSVRVNRLSWYRYPWGWWQSLGGRAWPPQAYTQPGQGRPRLQGLPGPPW